MKHLVVMILAVVACSAESPPPRPDAPAPPQPRPVASPPEVRPRATAPADKQADPRAVAEANDLLKQGLAAYHLGEYDEAEAFLKRSITIYPFLAPANLALGKVFLLRGAATRDEALIESARLMFDMAHSIDPQAREPMVLLELFRPQPVR